MPLVVRSVHSMSPSLIKGRHFGVCATADLIALIPLVPWSSLETP